MYRKLENNATNQHIKFIGTTPSSYQNICTTSFGKNDGLFEWRTISCRPKPQRTLEAALHLIGQFFVKDNFLIGCLSIVTARLLAVRNR